MSYDDDLQTLRNRMADQIDGLDGDRQGGASSASLLVQTTTVTTYPTVAGRYYGVRAIDPGGTESEGSSATYGTPGGTFYALNVGAAIPATGTMVLVTQIGGRWIMKY